MKINRIKFKSLFHILIYFYNFILKSSLDVSASHRSRANSSKRRDLVSEIYYDQRNYSSLGYSKPVPSYHIRSSSLHSDPAAPTRSYRPSEYSYSSRASSVRSSPVSSDFSDQSETAADYFSRSSRRGSIVSDADDSQVLTSVSVMLLFTLW
ncbi:leucine-rich repeat flightless-interacting protein 2-like [Corvus moneduloides]|uniref:leucine-rich repeat flightless-interacting protein 2-like n=1 Tax=Corvus moneduloides TaxID=1196302 RepID=UPI0013639F58|nr:leucine-rich repeat flightless-interacting protein 2-like [Corvus moneduloides]